MTNLTPDEYCVRLIDLPTTVKAIVSYDEDGFPNVFVNARLSVDEQRRAVAHELRHIDRDDAYNGASIQSVEATKSSGGDSRV